MRGKRYFKFLLSGGLFLFAATVLQGQGNLTVGAAAPGFSLTKYENGSVSGAVSLSQFSGKIVVLSFFGST